MAKILLCIRFSYWLKLLCIFGVIFFQDIYASFQFPGHLKTQTEIYVKNLEKEYDSLSKKDFHKTKSAFEKLAASEKWQEAFVHAQMLLGISTDDVDILIDVAIFCHHARQKIQKRKWEYRKLQEVAVYFAFINSETNIQKAKALILYALLNDLEGVDQSILEQAHTFCAFDELKKDDKRFVDLLLFKFIKHEVEESPEGSILHLKFSQKLDCHQPENYLEIDPKVDGYISTSLNEITVSGLVSGKEYSVKVRSGIKSIFGETITKTEAMKFFVKDITPHISFSPNAYIYPLQEKIHIPIHVLNIDDAAVTLYRVPDRQIIEKLSTIFNSSGYLWGSLEEVFTTTVHFDGNKIPNQTLVKNLNVHNLVSELKPGFYVLSAKQKGSFSDHEGERATQWFTVTDIGLSSYVSDDALIVHARSFATAKPLENIHLDLISANNDILASVKTDEDGFAEFPKEVLLGKDGKAAVCVFATDKKSGFSVLFLNRPAFDFSDRGVKGRVVEHDYDVMLFTDRGIYRPEEVVHIGAVLRNGRGEEIAPTPLTLVYRTPSGVEVKRETLKGNDLGVYTGEFKLPVDSVMGIWSVDVYVDPTQKPIGHKSFQVDDFSPNKLELTLKSDIEVVKLGEALPVKLSAYYLYGAPVNNHDAIIEGKVTEEPAPFEEWKEFHFGDDREEFISQVLPAVSEEIVEGKAEYKVDIPDSIKSTKALRVELNARLLNSNASQGAALNILLFPKTYLLGAKEQDSQDSDKVTIELIAVDAKGKLVDVQGLQYNFYKSTPKYQWYKTGGAWEYQLVYQNTLLKKDDIKIRANAPTVVSFSAEKGYPYLLEVKNKDGVTLLKYRLGKDFYSLKERPDILPIVPESKAIKLHDHAVLKVNAPFEGEATVIAGLNSAVLKDTIHLKEGMNVVKVPTSEAWGTGSYVMISLMRPLEKHVSGIKTKRAIGVQWVPIEATDHTLKIKLDVPKEIKSKSALKIPITLENAKDSNARVMIALIDEGVLGLTAFKVPDPIEYFFGQRQLAIEMHDVYGHLIDPVDADVINMRSGGGALMLRRGAFVPKLQEKVLSFFDGNVRVDNQGKANVMVDIPVFFGKVKVYALAFAKGKMGMQQEDVVIKDNLIVDASLPTFLTVGDATQIHVRFENTTDKDIHAEVNINLEKALKTNARKIPLKLAPKEQRNIPVDVEAYQLGEGAVSIAVEGIDIHYDHTFKIEVRAADQPLQVSQHFTLAKGEKKALKVEDLLKGLQVVDAQASVFITNQGPWNTGKILNWLLHYPFGCTEQVISKGFAAIYALHFCKDDEKDKDRIEYQRACYDAIDILNERQSSEGCWGLWKDGVDLKITAFAVEMLLYAKREGVSIPTHVLDKALGYIRKNISQARWQKKDSIKDDVYAWFVKLCAQTKGFDTATVRYCFDSYCDKKLSAVAKALFIAAVAEVQDMVRIKQGLYSLEENLKKGVSTEEMILIGAHLAPYAHVAEIKGVISRFEKALQQTSVHSVERFNTQVLAMVLKAQFEAAADQTQKLNVMIDDVKVPATQQIFKNIVPIKDTTIENAGDGMAWVFVNAFGVSSQESKLEQHGVTVKRTFYKVDGSEVGAENIILGERLIVVLEGEIQKPDHNTYWLISDWLPAGFSHADVLAKYKWLENLTATMAIQKRYDRYIASFQQHAGGKHFKIAYEVVVTHPGDFVQPGLYMESIGNPSQYARYTKEMCRIKKSAL